MDMINIPLFYRKLKRHPLIIPICLLTFSGSNYSCLEQISMVPKMFDPFKFDCISEDGGPPRGVLLPLFP